MKTHLIIYILTGLMCWCYTLTISAQDPIPLQLQPQDTLRNPDIHLQHGARPIMNAVKVNNSMPKSFRNTAENQITNEQLLYPIFDKLAHGTEPVRIVQIGDSHVRGHVFSVAARHTLENAFGSQAVYPDEITYKTDALAHETGAPGIVYHAIGINGATTTAFCNEEKVKQIKDLQPDLIILSFGTNECHTCKYDPVEHYAQMDAILTLINHYIPDATVMLTTPPGAYVRYSRRRKVVNPRTDTAVKTILRFAQDRELPVWDQYNIVGGKKNACTNWLNNRMMQRDQIHFTHNGYTLQGNLLGEAILNAFNNYVAN